MADTPQTETLKNIASVVTSKRSRSIIFLVAAFLVIVVINGILPLISGRAKYTTESKEMTYKEYTELQTENYLINLTYASQQDIEDYKKLYTEKHPELTPEEIFTIIPPDNMKVSAYTKFFFESYWWYIDTGISMLSTVLMYYAIFNYLNTRTKEINLDFKRGEYTMKQLNENYLDPDTFEPWIHDTFNRERKVKQHIRNAHHELKVLETKTPYKIRRKFIEYFENFEREDYQHNRFIPSTTEVLTQKEYHYRIKKEELLLQLRKEYIATVPALDGIKNFKEIKPGFVYSGVNTEGVGQDEYSSIKSDQQRVRGSLLSKILMSIAVSLGFASLLTVLAIDFAAQSPVWLTLSVLVKIAPLIIQIYFAFNYSNWFTENQLLPNLKFRENIAMMYLAEMKRQGKQTEPIIINKIEIVSPVKNKKGEQDK